MKIIVTRPSPDAEIFAQLIDGEGAEVILSPVMAIRPRNVAIDFSGVGALAFTSANGVRAFAALSGDRALAVFAVGVVTAEAARQAGFQNIETAEGDVESLAALIARTKPSLSVLHFAGSERIGDLVKALADSGVKARRAVIYDAVENAEMAPEAASALRLEPENCVVTFFSPRSARLFTRQGGAAGLAERLKQATALAMSAQIAEAAREAGWARVEIAADRSMEAMAALANCEIAARKGRIA